MFARRVFELLASGTPVVSTPSRGMVETFPGLVDAVDSAAGAEAALDRLLSDGRYWDHRSREGIRSVMLNHTYAHRVAQIARTVGLPEPAAGPSVAVVCTTWEEATGLHRTLDGVRGVGEIAVPSDAPGEVIQALSAGRWDLRRVVCFDPVPGSPVASRVAAAGRLRSSWLVEAADVAGRGPDMLTDLAVATVFAPTSTVAAATGGDRSCRYEVRKPTRGDVLALRTVDVCRGRDVDETLVAWIGR
jgi:hypothetical protein